MSASVPSLFNIIVRSSVWVSQPVESKSQQVMNWSTIPHWSRAAGAAAQQPRFSPPSGDDLLLLQSIDHLCKHLLLHRDLPKGPLGEKLGSPHKPWFSFWGLHIFGTIWMFTIRGDGVIEKYFNWFCWLINPWGCCFRGCPLHAAPAIGGTAGAQSMLRMRQNPRAPEVDLQPWAGVGFLLNYIELLEICTKGCGYSVHIMAQKSRIMVGP